MTPTRGITRTRVLAAAIMAPLAIAAVLLLPTPWMAALSAAVFLLGLWEWLRLTEIDDPIARGVLMVASHLVFAVNVWAMRPGRALAHAPAPPAAEVVT